ncbi:MAG: hypothetical protein HY914_10200 [Desulfomonile tiedjei]|nr:hypothetical protein [Desulfomonile tiedjei]
MPGQTVNQAGATIAKRIQKEVATFDSILWGALGQQKANPKKRTEMVAAAFDNLRSFMVKTLASAGTTKIARPDMAGKGVSTMPVKEKIESDIQRLHQRIAVLKGDPANAAFFVQGGGQMLDPISVAELVGKPVVDDAQPEDLADALATLQEAVGSLLTEIQTLSAQSQVAKAAADPNASSWDGIYTKANERQQLIAKFAQEKRKSFDQPANWDGVWSGRA